MMTRISMADDADSWCRRLGNFAPLVYRPTLLAATSASASLDAPGSGRYPRIPVPAQRRLAAERFLLVATVVTATMLPLSAIAQMQGGGMGGHGGGHGSRGGRPPDAAQKGPDASAPRAPDPLRALLGEARRLRMELLLGADQIGAWSAMEDALRECIELNRAPAPVADSAAPIDAQLFVQDLADNQRALADAEARLAAATKTAFGILNPRQLRTSQDRFASAIAGARTAAP